MYKYKQEMLDSTAPKDPYRYKYSGGMLSPKKSSPILNADKVWDTNVKGSLGTIGVIRSKTLEKEGSTTNNFYLPTDSFTDLLSGINSSGNSNSIKAYVASRALTPQEKEFRDFSYDNNRQLDWTNPDNLKKYNNLVDSGYSNINYFKESFPNSYLGRGFKAANIDHKNYIDEDLSLNKIDVNEYKNYLRDSKMIADFQKKAANDREASGAKQIWDDDEVAYDFSNLSKEYQEVYDALPDLSKYKNMLITVANANKAVNTLGDTLRYQDKAYNMVGEGNVLVIGKDNDITHAIKKSFNSAQNDFKNDFYKNIEDQNKINQEIIDKAGEAIRGLYK